MTMLAFLIPSLPVFAAGTPSSSLSVDIANSMAIAIETDNIEIEITPNIHGVFNSSMSTIKLSSNAVGYKLYISDSDENTNLTLQQSSLKAELNTSSTPSSFLALDSAVTISSTDSSSFPANSWGYSTDGDIFKGIRSTLALVSSYRASNQVDAMGEKNVTLYFGAKADLAIEPGVYKDTIVYTVIPELSPAIATLFDIHEMQEMTSTICNNTPTPTTDATGPATSFLDLYGHLDSTGSISDLVPETTLVDTRDNREYLVRKLADGNCWMAQNLELDLSTLITLTPADSDVTSNWTPQNDTQTTTGIAWSYEANDGSARSYSPKNESYLPSDIVTDRRGQCINTENNNTADCSTLTATEQHTNRIGNYYNWFAAVAESGAKNTPGEYDAPDSICPKGWTLPLGRDNDINKSFWHLLRIIYSVDADSGAAKLLDFPFNFIRSGSYDWTGALINRGVRSMSWSRSAYENVGYSLQIADSWVQIGTRKADGKGLVGATLRCVSK